MSKKIQFGAALAAAILIAGPVCFAQSAEATYKAKCAMCHGARGMADSGPGKAMKIKPVTDPSVQKMSQAQMIGAVQHGMGKMSAYQGKLTEAQIKDVVVYFRTFLK
jgi:cytochrome c6